MKWRRICSINKGKNIDAGMKPGAILTGVDLHIHTCFSDGQSRPADIVQCAAALGYELIAITDHDGTGGIDEAMDAAARLDSQGGALRVLTGMELATETADGIGLHILGYDFDRDDRALRETLEELARRREKRNIRMVGVLHGMGYDITMEELEEKQPNGFIGKPVIARLLADKGYVADYREAFKYGQFLESPEARKIKKEKLETSEAIALIRNAGGKAVLAHPIQTNGVGEIDSEEFFANMDGMIAQLKAQGLEGLECYHPDQNSAQSARFVQIAVKHSLFVTRGSDFHGCDFAEADETAPVTDMFEAEQGK